MEFYVHNIHLLAAVCFALILKPEVSHGQQPETTDYKGRIPDEVTPEPYDYYYYNYMPGDMFAPGSPFCVQKSTCESNSFSWPAKNCYCDDLCKTFEDCCPNHMVSDVVNAPSVDLFECEVIPEIGNSFGVFYVNRCSPEWSDEEIKTLCETRQYGDDVLLGLPVSENGTDILFKNMYCAFCNQRYDFQFWKPEMTCEVSKNDTTNYTISSITGCKMVFLPPSRDIVLKYRKCPLQGIIQSCPPDVINEEVIYRCEQGNTSYVFAALQTFKNIACAECHGIPTNRILCEPAEVTTLSLVPPMPKDKRKWYSFRVLVDFNSEEGEFGELSKETDLKFSEMCSDEEIYDPFTEKCRKIFCIPPRIAVKGKCIITEANETFILSKTLSPNFFNVSTIIRPNCTLIKLNQSEYDFRNNSQIYVYATQKLYNDSEYYQIGLDLFICHSDLPSCESGCETINVFYSDVIESYVSLISLIISLTALAFNFFVYICFSQLRNTPGKILMCLIISLFFAQLFFLIAPQFEEYGIACTLSAIVVHFFYMAAFCWMNVIALDLWMTFSNQFITVGSNDKSKRFLYFSLYGWLIPGLIVGFSIIIDNVDTESGLRNFQPGYGDGACWMTSQNGVLLLFAGPLVLFKFFDCIAFINTARHIYKAKKHGAVARQNNDSCTFWINLKLSLVMGLTWVFAFVANFANIRVIWYLFILFNALQGVFIAVSFIFTKKVIRLLADKAHTISSLVTKPTTVEISTSEKAKSSNNSSGTKLTSVSQSDERV